MFGKWQSFSFYKIICISCFVSDICSLVPPLRSTWSETEEYLEEQSRVANDILDNYDLRFIPTRKGLPLDVRLKVVIADILKVDDMEAEMLIYIKQTWYDYRLSWNGTRRLKIREHFLDKIWEPDVRIINLKEAKRFEGLGGVNMNIYPSGRVYFSQMVLIKTICPMDLHSFPLDRQTCFLNFTSFAYSKDWLNYTTDGKHVVIKHTRLPQFDLIETREIEGESKGPGVTISLTFQRRFGYFMMSIYVPSAAIVMLSWLSFFMQPSNIADRLALEITMILTIVFLLDGINKSIIHVSYAKASDIFVIVSFCFIFLALFETMLVYRLFVLCQEKKTRNCSKCGTIGCYEAPPGNDGSMHDSEIEELKVERALKCCSVSWALWIDKMCIILFPAVYLTFNIVYWNYYISAVKK